MLNAAMADRARDEAKRVLGGSACATAAQVAGTSWELSVRVAGRSCRQVILSFRYTRVRCCSTVLTVMKSIFEISRFVYWSAARAATRCSDSDSDAPASGARRSAGMPLELGMA